LYLNYKNNERYNKNNGVGELDIKSFRELPQGNGKKRERKVH